MFSTTIFLSFFNGIIAERYDSPGSIATAITAEEAAYSEVRKVDMWDACHNQFAIRFGSTDKSLDEMLSRKEADKLIPPK